LTEKLGFVTGVQDWSYERRHPAQQSAQSAPDCIACRWGRADDRIAGREDGLGGKKGIDWAGHSRTLYHKTDRLLNYYLLSKS
jgi:hypothetical protein